MGPILYSGVSALFRRIYLFRSAKAILPPERDSRNDAEDFITYTDSYRTPESYGLVRSCSRLRTAQFSHSVPPAAKAANPGWNRAEAFQ
jgi:hypothetical protein